MKLARIETLCRVVLNDPAGRAAGKTAAILLSNARDDAERCRYLAALYHSLQGAADYCFEHGRTDHAKRIGELARWTVCVELDLPPGVEERTHAA